MDVFFTWLAAEFVALCHWCTGVMDPVLGWLLTVPYDFAILFVGIAVDFSIQFCVRYREMRLEAPDPAAALHATGARVGVCPGGRLTTS